MLLTNQLKTYYGKDTSSQKSDFLSSFLGLIFFFCGAIASTLKTLCLHTCQQSLFELYSPGNIIDMLSFQNNSTHEKDVVKMILKIGSGLLAIAYTQQFHWAVRTLFLSVVASTLMEVSTLPFPYPWFCRQTDPLLADIATYTTHTYCLLVQCHHIFCMNRAVICVCVHGLESTTQLRSVVGSCMVNGSADCCVAVYLVHLHLLSSRQSAGNGPVS